MAAEDKDQAQEPAAAPDPAKKTLGVYANLPGSPLEEIENQEVTVAKIEITTRRLRDNPDAPFAVITLADGTMYHTWSAYLIEKLEQIPSDGLPGETTFKQVKTANKREVWTLE